MSLKVSNEPIVIPLPPQNAVTDLPEKYQALLKKRKVEHTKEGEKKDTDTIPEGIAEEDREAAEALLKEARGEEGDMTEEGSQLTIDLPLILKYRNPKLDGIEDEEERFRVDVKSRPDEASLDDYDRIPVSEFGMGYLRGIGWAPGKPIGLTNAKVVEPIEFIRKPNEKGGLGSQALPAEPPKPSKKFIKPGESREKPEPQVLPQGPEGVARHIRRAGEKLVPLSQASGVYEGATVYVTEGTHAGLKAKILKMDGDILYVKLLPSNVEVKIHKTKVSAHKNSDKEQSKSKSKSSSSSSSSKKSKSWLFPHLIVRVVSKSFHDGKYYLLKGSVIDVIDDSRCTLKMEGTNKLVDVKLDILETVIPKEGNRVMVVAGEYKGFTGTLMQKSKGKGSVQLDDDLSFHTFDFDLICSYVSQE